MANETNHKKDYVRFSAAQRFEHFVLITSMIGLFITGLPQRYAEYEWAKTIINSLGGIESVRIVHRFMASLMIAGSIFHGGVLSYKIFVLGERLTMIPTLKDLWNVRDYILFNLGFKKDHPHMPRYNFGEKAEYLAVVWGTVLMVATGFMMWNPVATAKVLPGNTIPAALEAHSMEALLAFLAVVIWHMYNVHFKTFNKSMFTGKLSYKMMKEEHAEELEIIERGGDKVVIPAGILATRKKRFWPYAIVMTLILVSIMFYFVTFEETSIQTVPRQNVVVFALDVVPETGDAAVGETLWPTLRCARCHGVDANGIGDVPSLVQVDLEFDKFLRTVRNGKGEEMPAFSEGEISNAFLFHVWTWLQTLTIP